MLNAIADLGQRGPLAPTNWLPHVTSYRPDGGTEGARDSQNWWYARNLAIQDFLRTIPVDRQFRICREDIMSDPDTHLRAVAWWLGVRTDNAAIEAMKHPENSPSAFARPPAVRFGDDPCFLEQPALRLRIARVEGLDASLDWDNGTRELTPKVKALATDCGYA